MGIHMHLGEVYRKFKPYYLRLASLYVAPQDAEDVLHDAFLEAHIRDASAQHFSFKIGVRAHCAKWKRQWARIDVGLPINLSDAADLAEVLERRMAAERAKRVLTQDEIDALLTEHRLKPQGELARRIRIAKRKAREALEPNPGQGERGVHVAYVLQAPSQPEPPWALHRQRPRSSRQLLQEFEAGTL